MRFWDTSALVPLCVEENTTVALLDLAAEPPPMATWWGSYVEVTSALARREREGQLPAPLSEDAYSALHNLASSWREVTASTSLRALAERLLRVHVLRAGDSLQLAAALKLAGDDATSVEFVCLDKRLRQAAAREGFRLLPRQI